MIYLAEVIEIEKYQQPITYKDKVYRYSYILYTKDVPVHSRFLGNIWDARYPNDFDNFMTSMPPELRILFDKWAGEYGGLDLQEFLDRVG